MVNHYSTNNRRLGDEARLFEYTSRYINRLKLFLAQKRYSDFNQLVYDAPIEIKALEREFNEDDFARGIAWDYYRNAIKEDTLSFKRYYLMVEGM